MQRDNRATIGRNVRVSVVLPVYNERAVLEQLTSAVLAATRLCSDDCEIVFVNDGSTDGSAEVLDELAEQYSHLRVVHFSRNFGHQAALQAGLQFATGDVLVVMDSDLQDDPQAIPQFLAKWRDGFDVVYAVRTARKEGWLKRTLFRSFYRVLNRISHTPLPVDAGNFGLIDRRVAEDLIQLSDRDRYFPGLRGWVGYRQTGVTVERLARHDDQPRVSFRGLIRLAKTAIFSFSTMPLTVFYVIAAISCLVCFGLTGFTLYHKLLTGAATPGWTSGLITASFFGMLNALGIAILGEYVTRIYDQVRSRPLFLVERTVNAQQRVCSQTDAPKNQRKQDAAEPGHLGDAAACSYASNGLESRGFAGIPQADLGDKQSFSAVTPQQSLSTGHS